MHRLHWPSSSHMIHQRTIYDTVIHLASCSLLFVPYRKPTKPGVSDHLWFTEPAEYVNCMKEAVSRISGSARKLDIWLWCRRTCILDITHCSLLEMSSMVPGLVLTGVHTYCSVLTLLVQDYHISDNVSIPIRGPLIHSMSSDGSTSSPGSSKSRSTSSIWYIKNHTPSFTWVSWLSIFPSITLALWPLNAKSAAPNSTISESSGSTDAPRPP